jgi:hypothetical protein
MASISIIGMPSDPPLSHLLVSHVSVAAHEMGMRRIAGSLPAALLVFWSCRPLAGEADRRGAGPLLLIQPVLSHACSAP